MVQSDFIGANMCRKFLEMGFTRARRYANHKSGRKYVSRPPYYHTGDRGGVSYYHKSLMHLLAKKQKLSTNL